MFTQWAETRLSTDLQINPKKSRRTQQRGGQGKPEVSHDGEPSESPSMEATRE